MMDGLDRLIALALDEDLGAAGDVTTQALQHAAPVGEEKAWTERLLAVVRPFMA